MGLSSKEDSTLKWGNYRVKRVVTCARNAHVIQGYPVRPIHALPATQGNASEADGSIMLHKLRKGRNYHDQASRCFPHSEFVVRFLARITTTYAINYIIVTTVATLYFLQLLRNPIFSH